MELDDPSGAVEVVCEDLVVWACGPVRADLEPFDEREASQVGEMSESRRNEFLTGRALLRTVLDPFGHGAAPVPVGPERAPVFPAGVTGTVTHSGGWVAAAASDRWRGIGLDLETDQDLAPSLVRRLAAPNEAPDLPLVRFVVKEAVFKACSPIDGQWREFEDVAVELESCTVGLTWTRDPVPGPVTGRWARADGWVAALVLVG